MKSFVFNVVSGEEGLRIDKFLSEKLVEITRSAIQSYIADGEVSVNKKNSGQELQNKNR